MQLTDGRYELKADPNPPGQPSMRIVIGSSGTVMTDNYGDSAYDSGNDWYSNLLAKVAIRFIDSTHFMAIVGGPAPAPMQTYTGEYHKLKRSGE